MEWAEENGKTDTNKRLRDLVRRSGLKSAVAMTVFNRDLGARACTSTRWKGYLADPSDKSFVRLEDDLWEHALKQFECLGRRD